MLIIGCNERLTQAFSVKHLGSAGTLRPRSGAALADDRKDYRKFKTRKYLESIYIPRLSDSVERVVRLRRAEILEPIRPLPWLFHEDASANTNILFYPFIGVGSFSIKLFPS
jgi:hypothetical protein